jgi:uridine kinase
VSPERAAVLEALASALAAIEAGHPLRVGIDGVDGAGKTTLADELAPLVAAVGRPVVRASVDDFHRPRDDRYRRREHSPEGFYLDTFDYDAVRRLLLEPLGPGGDLRVRTRSWDHTRDLPVPEEWLAVEPGAVVLCDGVFLQRDELRELWDVTVFVDAEIAAAAERGAVRDAGWMPSLEATRERYRVRYTPAQRRYLEELAPRERADFVVENTEPGAPRLLRPRG